MTLVYQKSTNHYLLESTSLDNSRSTHAPNHTFRKGGGILAIREHGLTEHLGADLLDSFGRKEGERLRGSNWRDPMSFKTNFFHGSDPLRRMESKMLVWIKNFLLCHPSTVYQGLGQLVGWSSGLLVAGPTTRGGGGGDWV